MSDRNDIEERLRREERRANIVIRVIGAIAVLALLAAVLAGCKTKTVVVTEYRDRQVHDTTLQVDSVWRDRWHTEYLKGDTVFIHDSVYIDRYKYRDKAIEVHVKDSVPYPVEVIVEKHVRNGYDKFVSWAFWVIVAGGLLTLAGWLLNKRYGWLKWIKRIFAF